MIERDRRIGKVVGADQQVIFDQDGETPLHIRTDIGSTTFFPDAALFIPFDEQSAPVRMKTPDLDRLRKFARGMSYAEIAQSEEGAEQSIKNAFFYRIRPMLGANDQAHALTLAVMKGFLTPEQLGPVGLDLPRPERRPGHNRR